MTGKLVWIFVSAMVVNNFTLSYFLGLCPFFGVSGRLDTALRLGLANIFVMVITSLGGRRVSDRERFLEAFRSGGKWGAYASKYVLAREDYPGIERLMATVQ